MIRKIYLIFFILIIIVFIIYLNYPKEYISYSVDDNGIKNYLVYKNYTFEGIIRINADTRPNNVDEMYKSGLIYDYNYKFYLFEKLFDPYFNNLAFESKYNINIIENNKKLGDNFGYVVNKDVNYDDIAYSEQKITGNIGQFEINCKKYKKMDSDLSSICKEYIYFIDNLKKQNDFYKKLDYKVKLNYVNITKIEEE